MTTTTNNNNRTFHPTFDILQILFSLRKIGQAQKKAKPNWKQQAIKKKKENFKKCTA